MSVASCTSSPVDASTENSSQFRQGKFYNTAKINAAGMAKLPKIIWRYLFEKRSAALPEKPIPLVSIDQIQLTAGNNSEPVIYRLGHSSLLLIVQGELWLIDPVFSERASPFSWMGPKRFHALPLDVQLLSKIRGVIISHDHYDHLDRQTIESLMDKVESFVTPLGVGRHLEAWGVDPDKIHQLDWWQNIQLGELSLTATPAQHFSGRGLTDGNETLWASWVIQYQHQSLQHKIFFSGDSGYFNGFKTIGERFGPFDLTLIENGAYDKDWADVHMTPEQTMQAHLDLGGNSLMPVHNSTFDLALHPWYEPFERLSVLAKTHKVNLVTPVIGQGLSLAKINKTPAWWRAVAGI